MPLRNRIQEDKAQGTRKLHGTRIQQARKVQDTRVRIKKMIPLFSRIIL